MAAQQATSDQEAAADKAVALDGRCAVLRAAGQEAAGRRDERRNEELVEPDEGDTGRPRQARDHGVLLLNWRRRDRNSASSRAYTTPGSAARAFTTMSTLSMSALCLRKISLTSRLARFRWTAPPMRRGAGGPSRRPPPAVGLTKTTEGAGGNP